MLVQPHYVYQTHSISLPSALLILPAITIPEISSTSLIHLSTQCCCGMKRLASTNSAFLSYTLFYSQKNCCCGWLLINKNGCKTLMLDLSCVYHYVNTYFLLSILDEFTLSHQITTPLQLLSSLLFITFLDWFYYFIFVRWIH